MKKFTGALSLIVLILTVQALAQTQQAKTGPVIRTQPGASGASNGAAISPEQFKQIIAFHGHSCAGLAMGVRVAQAAARELGVNTNENELVAIVETNKCPVDAIQVLMHTTAGKRNLIYQAHDRNVFTFVRRSDGKGIRITVKDDGWGKSDPAFDALRAKTFKGQATAEEKRRFDELMQARAAAILSAPEDQLLTIEPAKVDLQEKLD